MFSFSVIVTCYFEKIFSFLSVSNDNSFIVRLVYYEWYFVFHIPSFRKQLNKHMAKVMMHVILGICADYSESCLFISANAYEKYIVCKDFCIYHHHDKLCFLPICRSHIILIKVFDELLHELDAFCFTYQHMDCPYTLFRYRFGGKMFANSGKVFDNVQEAVYISQRNNGLDICAALQETLFRQNNKKWLMSFFQQIEWA